MVNPNMPNDEVLQLPDKSNKKPNPSNHKPKKSHLPHIPTDHFNIIDQRLLRYWVCAIGSDPVRVYEIILDTYYVDKQCSFIPLNAICNATGFGRKQIQKHIKTLKHYKLITVKRGGRGRCNQYVPLLPYVDDIVINLIKEKERVPYMDHLGIFTTTSLKGPKDPINEYERAKKTLTKGPKDPPPNILSENLSVACHGEHLENVLEEYEYPFPDFEANMAKWIDIWATEIFNISEQLKYNIPIQALRNSLIAIIQEMDIPDPEFINSCVLQTVQDMQDKALTPNKLDNPGGWLRKMCRNPEWRMNFNIIVDKPDDTVG